VKDAKGNFTGTGVWLVLERVPETADDRTLSDAYLIAIYVVSKMK